MNIAARIGVSRLALAISVASMADALGNGSLFIELPLYVVELLAPATAFLGGVLSTLQMAGLRALQGLASAAIAAPAFALTSDHSKVGGEGQQMSLLAMGFRLGVAIRPLIAGVLALIAFELPFPVAGVMLFAGLWIVPCFEPQRSSRAPPEPPGRASIPFHKPFAARERQRLLERLLN